jgi:hypothetical protein
MRQECNSTKCYSIGSQYGHLDLETLLQIYCNIRINYITAMTANVLSILTVMISSLIQSLGCTSEDFHYAMLLSAHLHISIRNESEGWDDKFRKQTISPNLNFFVILSSNILLILFITKACDIPKNLMCKMGKRENNSRVMKHKMSLILLVFNVKQTTLV